MINSVGERLTGVVGRRFDKGMYFSGMEDICVQTMRFSILVVHYIKYFLYTCRMRRRIPTAPQCIYELEGLIRTLGTGERWALQIEDKVEIALRRVL